MINLHLGCGQNVIPGFINCDLYAKNDFISQIDAKRLPFIDSSIDKIYACHILEHFYRYEVCDVLMEWNRVLKKGGELYVAVPDFESVVNHYVKHHDIKILQGLLNGGQNCDWNKHLVSFDFKYLEECLKETKFGSVQLYDWKECEFAKYDDFSQAYLPHMNKEKGMKMSLNVYAKKD